MTPHGQGDFDGWINSVYCIISKEYVNEPGEHIDGTGIANPFWPKHEAKATAKGQSCRGAATQSQGIRSRPGMGLIF